MRNRLLTCFAIIMASSTISSRADLNYSDYDAFTTVIKPTKISGDIVIPSHVSKSGTIRQVNRFSNDAFKGQTTITSVSIPYTITEMGHSVFDGCTSLERVYYDAEWGKDTPFTNVVSGSSQTYVYHYWFANCPIKYLEIGEHVKRIPSGAFTGCNKIEEIKILGPVDVFSPAFSSCKAVKKLYIKQMKMIRDKGFSAMTALGDVYAGYQEPQDIPEGAFAAAAYTGATLHVPAGTKEKYQAATGWSNFTTMVEDADAVFAAKPLATLTISNNIVGDIVLPITTGEPQVLQLGALASFPLVEATLDGIDVMPLITETGCITIPKITADCTLALKYDIPEECDINHDNDIDIIDINTIVKKILQK